MIFNYASCIFHLEFIRGEQSGYRWRKRINSLEKKRWVTSWENSNFDKVENQSLNITLQIRNYLWCRIGLLLFSLSMAIVSLSFSHLLTCRMDKTRLKDESIWQHYLTTWWQEEIDDARQLTPRNHQIFEMSNRVWRNELILNQWEIENERINQFDLSSLCGQLISAILNDRLKRKMYFAEETIRRFFFYRSISLMPHLFDKCVYCWNWNQQVACCFKLPSPFLLPSVTVAAVFNTRYFVWSCRILNLLEKREENEAKSSKNVSI